MPDPKRIAVVSPRFPGGGTVGGAETLLKTLAGYAADAGIRVSCFSTCARNHFSWENELPAGTRTVDGLEITFCPVNRGRDLETFLAIQQRIDRRRPISAEEERTWLRNSVNSDALCQRLGELAAHFDRIVVGPYLFGITHAVARIAPEKTLLVPCLHDEPFAYLSVMRELFTRCRTIAFNSEPERDLAGRLYGQSCLAMPVVGMGFPPFKADPEFFKRRHDIRAPYLIYSGRREVLKGTPLLMDYLDVFRKRTKRDVRLVLTGAGAIEPPADLVSSILDLGFVDDQEKWNAMAGALAFCHPSVNESFGIVIMEAMLAGTPVLVHAAGDVLREACRRSGGGLWFRHYPDFEEALVRLMDQPGLTERLAAGGQAYVRKTYAVDAVTKRWMEALSL